MERLVEKRQALQLDVGDILHNLSLEKNKKRMLYSLLFCVFGLKVEGQCLSDKSTEVTEVELLSVMDWRCAATCWLSIFWDLHPQPSLMTGPWLSRSKLDTTLPVFHACSQHSAFRTSPANCVIRPSASFFPTPPQARVSGHGSALVSSFQ